MSIISAENTKRITFTCVITAGAARGALCPLPDTDTEKCPTMYKADSFIWSDYPRIGRAAGSNTHTIPDGTRIGGHSRGCPSLL